MVITVCVSRLQITAVFRMILICWQERSCALARKWLCNLEFVFLTNSVQERPKPIMVRSTMMPVGYMAKQVIPRPEWLQAQQVVDIYSVSSCMSKNFADYIKFWKHNGYWFFDSPNIIQQLAHEQSIDLSET